MNAQQAAALSPSASERVHLLSRENYTLQQPQAGEVDDHASFIRRAFSMRVRDAPPEVDDASCSVPSDGFAGPSTVTGDVDSAAAAAAAAAQETAAALTAATRRRESHPLRISGFGHYGRSDAPATSSIGSVVSNAAAAAAAGIACTCTTAHSSNEGDTAVPPRTDIDAVCDLVEIETSTQENRTLQREYNPAPVGQSVTLLTRPQLERKQWPEIIESSGAGKLYSVPPELSTSTADARATFTHHRPTNTKSRSSTPTLFRRFSGNQSLPSGEAKIPAQVMIRGEDFIPVQCMGLKEFIQSGVMSNHRHPVWIDIFGADSEDATELVQVFGAHGIHPLTLEDCVTRYECEKVDIFDTYVFAVLSEVSYSLNRSLSYTNVSVIVLEKMVISFHQELCPSVEYVAQIVQDHNEGNVPASSWVLYSLLDHIVDTLLELVYQLVVRGEELQREVLNQDASGMNTTLLNIANVQTMISDFERTILPKRSAVRALLRGKSDLLMQVAVYLLDIMDHLTQSSATLNRTHTLLESFTNMYLAKVSILASQSSNTMAIDMRRMSAFATLIMPWTVLSGTKHPHQLLSNHGQAFLG
eukprot:TRINITY_DN2647_c0_g2_i2.p1 TRINITY_DN2647_c0_g2~~TRINITY_DN2647_c0_g2_i2.p1  ORF type:complete len:586 (+),score=126.91 TRINITY_DN2647_c0_g2_i2:40-1797(+)